MKPARACSVDGRPIRVYDGLLGSDDIYRLTMAMESSAFMRDEVARPDTADVRHWVVNIPLEQAVQLPVYAPTLAAAADISGQQDRYEIYRCYCNHASFGDMLFTHTDCLPGAAEFTALWYIAPQWDVEWGGETLFYNEAKDAEVAVSPRPGRLVVFDGAIRHAGKPPNRICYVPRYTLAFKLQPQAAAPKA
jgi:SM-20-related protein